MTRGTSERVKKARDNRKNAKPEVERLVKMFSRPAIEYCLEQIRIRKAKLNKIEKLKQEVEALENE